jgi:ABC-type antimicrobial peptide transport system permease subunit
VRERVPEFAVLETVGFGHRGIIGLVFAEAALQCLPGAVVGMALATVLSRLPLRFLPSELAGIAVPTMSPPVFALALLVAMALALASSAIPVVRLRNLRVNDALAGR